VNARVVFADRHLADALTAPVPSSLRPIADCQTRRPNGHHEQPCGTKSTSV